MSYRPGGLGRGLSALIPAATPNGSGLMALPRHAIVPNPHQPRSSFDHEELAGLAQSMRQMGLLQPVVVRPRDDGRYELVAGERRYRAAGMAGMETIPAIVRHTEDNQLLTEALVENIHRVDLNALEEAAAYRQLLDDFGFTHQELADRLGRSRSSISNALRLLTLSPELQQRVASGTLSAGHARALLAIDDVVERDRVARKIIADGLSVRAAEELARPAAHRSGEPGDARPAARRAATPYSGLQRRLSDALATRVTITGNATRGRVVIDFSGEEDLNRLLGILGGGTGEELLVES